MTNPYGSILLNDLHHHFPDLLYHHERFQSVQDVLGYIVQTAQRNPYEYGRQLHESRSFRPSAPPLLADSSLSSESSPPSESDSKQPYEFQQSSTAYSATTSPPNESVDPPPSQSTSSTSSSQNEAEQLLRALFQRRSILNPISRPPVNRFSISMPLDFTNLYYFYYCKSPVII